MDITKFEHLNPYKGKHVSKSKNFDRAQLISESEIDILNELSDKALSATP